MEQRDKPRPQVNEREWSSLVVVLPWVSHVPSVNLVVFSLPQDKSHSWCVGSMLTGSVRLKPSTRRSCSPSLTSRMALPSCRWDYWLMAGGVRERDWFTSHTPLHSSPWVNSSSTIIGSRRFCPSTRSRHWPFAASSSISITSWWRSRNTSKRSRCWALQCYMWRLCRNSLLSNDLT